jgi:hypothetical protein
MNAERYRHVRIDPAIKTNTPAEEPTVPNDLSSLLLVIS